MDRWITDWERGEPERLETFRDLCDIDPSAGDRVATS